MTLHDIVKFSFASAGLVLSGVSILLAVREDYERATFFLLCCVALAVMRY